MRFRPCIDIHNGQVKQIVGGSLKDEGNLAEENFASVRPADYFADLYRRDGLKGGHVILLNPPSSEYYRQTREQALLALGAYPGGLQIGGGITAGSAAAYLKAGASHVIVTSYVFCGGQIHWERLKELCSAVGREHVVLDVSCRKKEEDYYIVTDRWQTFTEVKLTCRVLDYLAEFCDEFLVHGVDVEGKAAGIDEGLAALLGGFKGLPVTYAGGIGSYEDIERFRQITGGHLDITIGSALDLFGGFLSYDKIKQMI